MTEPRKKKKRKTGRPLEDIPMRKLVANVKHELRDRIKMSMSDKPDKANQD